MKTTPFLLALMVVSFMATLASATSTPPNNCGGIKHPKGHDGMFGETWGVMEIGEDDPHGSLYLDYANELKLTEKQIKKLKELRLEAQEKAIKYAHQSHKAWAEVGELAHEKNVNRRKINDKIKQIGEYKTDMIKLKVMTMLDSKEILTREQQEKFDKLMEQEGPSPAPQTEKEEPND